MDPAYLDYLLFAAGTFALSTLGFAIAWIRARERAIRAEHRAAERLAAGAETRFDQLEQLAEGTALELERLGEGQRFLSRLLAERASAAASPASGSVGPGRVNTPQ